MKSHDAAAEGPALSNPQRVKESREWDELGEGTEKRGGGGFQNRLNSARNWTLEGKTGSNCRDRNLKEVQKSYEELLQKKKRKK